MEQQQAEVRAVRGNRAASAEARQRLAGLKAELRDYRAGLDPQEREAYRDYRAIRLEVKKCAAQKRFDRVERRIFTKLNPAYIYMIPAAFGAIFFTLLPFLFMMIGAFFKVDLVDIKNSRFVGLWNFKMIFTRDNEFARL